MKWSEPIHSTSLLLFTTWQLQVLHALAGHICLPCVVFYLLQPLVFRFIKIRCWNPFKCSTISFSAWDFFVKIKKIVCIWTKLLNNTEYWMVNNKSDLGCQQKLATRCIFSKTNLSKQTQNLDTDISFMFILSFNIYCSSLLYTEGSHIFYFFSQIQE